MLTQSRWWRRALVVALVTLLAAPPGVWADEDKDDKRSGEGPGPLGKPTDQTTFGWILAPTPEAARFFSPGGAGGVTYFRVSVTPDAEFVLDSTQSGGMRTCAVGICVESGDFDIVFFTEGTGGMSEMAGRFSGVGEEAGEVPEGASFALVFLKTPATSITAKGFEFYYTERV